MRRAAKRDLSETAVVATLRACGWSVAFWSGPNYPDLVVGKMGQTFLVEVKTGKGKLKPGQMAWHREWKGSPVVVLRDADDALRFSDRVSLGAAVNGTRKNTKVPHRARQFVDRAFLLSE